jgi:Protein of unknown function (DUF2914)
MPIMRGGSDDTRTPHDEPNAVDAAWDELLGETGKDDGDSGYGAEPVTGDHAASVADGSANAGGERDRSIGDGRRTDADDVMARLMGGEAPKLPPLEAEPRVAHEPVEPLPAMASVRDEAPARAPAKVIVRLDPPAPPPPAPERASDRSSKPSLRILEGAPMRVRETEEQPVRASRPAEPFTPAPTSARGLPFVWLGVGALVLGAVAYAATRKDDVAPSSVRSQATAEPLAQRPSREPIDAVGTKPSGLDTASEAGFDDDTADAEDDTSGAKPPTPRSSDPREPPPGTPPEIAAVFRRLPVGPADRPPVGGIGATGIHIDHIAMGSEMQGATCTGHANDFSVSAGDRAGVCVRVVHAREKEELQVLWQKHGGSTRRSKMVVLPMHAYRTRGYLVLRSEYLGDWTVRILSSDGVELARHDFTVVP